MNENEVLRKLVAGDLCDGKTAVDVWEGSTARFFDRPIFNFFGKKVRYAEAAIYVFNFAAWLREIGILPGDRVAILLPNCPQMVLADYGIKTAGAVPVPFDLRLTAEDIRFRLENSGATAIVALDLFFAKSDFRQVIDEASSVRAVILTGLSEFFTKEEMSSRLERYVRTKMHRFLPFLSGGKADYLPLKKVQEFEHVAGAALLKNVATWRDSSRVHLFAKMIKAPPRSDGVRSLPCVCLSDLASIIYTTGSTGPAKGAMISHAELVGGLRQTYAWFGGEGLGQDRFLLAAPLFHTMAQMLGQYLCNALGGEMLLVPNPLDLHEMERVIREGKPTIAFGPPRLAKALIALKKRGVEFSCLKLFVSGGGALSEETAREWAETFPEIPLLQGIGQTEAMPTICNPRRGKVKTLSLGVPLSETVVRVVVEENGSIRDAADGEVGEKLVFGPQVFSGYWNNPEETKKMFLVDENGAKWLKTGDLVFRDADGYYFFVDRKKDIIVTDNGENVFPGDIEKVLRSHPAVSLAAVVSACVKHGRGESIVAFVVPQEGYDPAHNLRQDLLAHCREYLKEYAVPHFVRFLEITEVPLSTKGEPLRPALRDLAKQHQ